LDDNDDDTESKNIKKIVRITLKGTFTKSADSSVNSARINDAKAILVNQIDPTGIPSIDADSPYLVNDSSDPEVRNPQITFEQGEISTSKTDQTTVYNSGPTELSSTVQAETGDVWSVTVIYETYFNIEWN